MLQTVNSIRREFRRGFHLPGMRHMNKQQPHTAVLLAAGRGQRLRPYTDHTPKPLLLFNGRPTLDYVLTAVAYAGIQQIILVTHHLAEQIEQFVGDGARWGLAAVYCRQPELLGTAHALQTAVNAHPTLFQDDTPFLLTATDYILPETYLADLIQAHTQAEVDITISLKEMAAEEVTARSSVAFTADGRLVHITEKPAPGQATSHFVASLTYVLPTAVTPYLQQMTPSPGGEFFLPDIINHMLADGFTAQGVVQPAPAEWKMQSEQ